MRRTKAAAMQTRRSVLQAAAQLIGRLGVSAFTIEAVAQEAGVTKGAVLHHFPSKEALIDALIDQVIEAFDGRLTAELAAEPEGAPGRWLRAYIRTVFSMQEEEKNIIPALAAAVAGDHRRLERIRHDLEKSQQTAVQDGLDPMEATIIRLAVDGIVFARALGLGVLDEESSQQVQAALFRLTGAGGRNHESEPK
jgi:AcrR family transcriptional regulator